MMEKNSKSLYCMYQTSNAYAMYTGVSVTSLLENNKDINHIEIFIVSSDMDDLNKQKFRNTAEHYDQKITFIDASFIIKRLKKMEVPPFHGAYATYYKLFAVNMLPEYVDNVLYLDADTLVVSSLAPILEVDLTSKIGGASLDCVPDNYKIALGLNPKDDYYNLGVFYYNTKEWKKENCQDKIVNFYKTQRTSFHLVDQDIFNILFQKKIKTMSPRFNLNSVFFNMNVTDVYKMHWLEENTYYSKKDMQHAVENPIVIHCMGAMTGKPWDTNSIHPQKDTFRKYMKLSIWKDSPLEKRKLPWKYKIQRLLYLYLPRPIYVSLYKLLFKNYLKKMNKKSQKKTNKDVNQ